MRFLVLIPLLILLLACRQEASRSTEMAPLNAQDLIDKSISVSGGDNFSRSSIGFYFRELYYTALRKNGEFTLSRIKSEGKDSIIDMISNDGFARFINNDFQRISDSLGRVYAASVNSVHYFSVLPYGLNDKAVQKELIGEEVVKDKTYFKIAVSFNKEGGGEDYEDQFVYWIGTSDYKVDYLAYSYEEDGETGLRFREAFNERYVNGLRFVDYKNYQPLDSDVALADLGKLFDRGRLDLLSIIALEDVKVQLLDL
jgi:hypothetical protein